MILELKVSSEIIIPTSLIHQSWKAGAQRRPQSTQQVGNQTRHADKLEGTM